MRLYSTSVLQRKFEEKYIPEPMSGCWLWLAQIQPNGYGMIHIGPGIKDYAHRVSYHLYKGAIALGLDVDHLCRLRCCVNPAHLEAITHAENLLRSPDTVPGRYARRTHCKYGHPLFGENLVSLPNRRRCKICFANTRMRYLDRKRGKK